MREFAGQGVQGLRRDAALGSGPGGFLDSKFAISGLARRFSGGRCSMFGTNAADLELRRIIPVFHDVDIPNFSTFAHFTELAWLFQVFIPDTNPALLRDTCLRPFSMMGVAAVVQDAFPSEYLARYGYMESESLISAETTMPIRGFVRQTAGSRTAARLSAKSR